MQYIIYHDKSFEEVDDKIANMLWEKSGSGSKGVEINGRKFFFSSIFKILTEEEYFRQYPDRRPAEVRNQFEDIYGRGGNNQIRQPTGKVCEQMKNGFIDFHLERGENLETAEKKWKMFLKSGVDYAVAKKVLQEAL